MGYRAGTTRPQWSLVQTESHAYKTSASLRHILSVSLFLSLFSLPPLFLPLTPSLSLSLLPSSPSLPITPPLFSLGFPYAPMKVVAGSVPTSFPPPPPPPPPPPTCPMLNYVLWLLTCPCLLCSCLFAQQTRHPKPANIPLLAVFSQGRQ